MKCSECKKKVHSCDVCGTDFEKGDDLLCKDELHFCSGDCFVEMDFSVGSGEAI